MGTVWCRRDKRPQGLSPALIFSDFVTLSKSRHLGDYYSHACPMCNARISKAGVWAEHPRGESYVILRCVFCLAIPLSVLSSRRGVCHQPCPSFPWASFAMAITEQGFFFFYIFTIGWLMWSVSHRHNVLSFISFFCLKNASRKPVRMCLFFYGVTHTYIDTDTDMYM